MTIPPFKLERFFAGNEFSVPYLLCCSDCESMTIQDLLALEVDASDLFRRQWLGYTESEGSHALRQEISRGYETLQPEHVLVHTGAEEAIFLFMQSALSPGDHLIVHSPCYQSLAEIGRSMGCEVTSWRADPEKEWRLDIEDLKRAIRANTRVLVINCPHNPTGFLMSGDCFQEVNRIVQKQGIILFSDEVYRGLEHSPADRLPAACDINERAASLGVLSKAYGLAGLRIGWIATHNAEIHSRMAALKDYTTICNSAPSEFLAELALRHRGELIHRNLEIIKRNLEILDGFFSRHAGRFIWKRPGAGPIAFPKLLGEEVGAFCRELAARAGVLLLPGDLLDDKDNRFRIGFGRRNLGEAVARLEEFLDTRARS